MIAFVLHNLLLLLTLNQCNEVYSLNILGVFPYQGRSHFYVFQPYLHELARRGHNLTVISYFPQDKPIKNYHDISLAGKSMIFENVIQFQESYIFTKLFSLVGLTYIAIDNCNVMLEDEDVQELWKTNTKFDVVVVEQFNSDCALGLAYILDAPVVGVTSHHLLPHQYNRFGITYNPSYMPFLFSHGGTKPTFPERFDRTVWHFIINFIYKFITQREEHRLLSKFFVDIPNLEELARNIKFLLLYNNFMLSGSNIYPSNIINVGGYHVAKPKPLQGELLKFLEESKYGVIYISFGSMLRSTSLPKHKLQAILEALDELPQRVVWKWEAKSLPGKPKNIYLSKWLPQNDLLAHPKVLAFFSHCGMLGTTEAVHHGVPIIGLPMFGDQPGNAATIEESGFGVITKMEELTKESLLMKFKSVLDPNFRANVKQLSRAWHDRPTSAMDSAVYWTEFAAKYRNFTFRTPAADVALYQYLYLDIFFALFVTSVIIVYTLFSVYKTLFVKKFKVNAPLNKVKKT